MDLAEESKASDKSQAYFWSLMTASRVDAAVVAIAVLEQQLQISVHTVL